MNTTYPTVSKEEIVDMFHFFLYWRCLEKQTTGVGRRHWHTSFELFSKVIQRLSVVPERRLERLSQDRAFQKMFGARILVIQQSDYREVATILDTEKKLPLAVKITPHEQVNGNLVDSKDLFARRKIFITARGMACGTIAAKAVSRLITRDDLERVWAEITAQSIPGFVHGIRNRGYSAWLESDGDSNHS
ncbi:MAG: hypothetical protein Q8P56_00890 [Candidatus Uhrbacteria bacterium]|nr:hypothetical protein [Candidatus Uhrbacteria bacterium]